MDKDKKSIGDKGSAWQNDISEKNQLLNSLSTNNWMIVLGDGKARGQRMITEKINELDQLLLSASQMTRNEAIRFMKKTKNDNKSWITLEKKM